MIHVEANRAALHQLLEGPTGPVAGELLRVGLAVQLYAVRLLHEPGSGRVYIRGGHSHQASAPGEPPASDYGHLAASITHDEIPHVDLFGLRMRVGTTAAQGRVLELGGDTGRGHASHIDARPYLRPALAAQRGGVL